MSTDIELLSALGKLPTADDEALKARNASLIRRRQTIERRQIQSERVWNWATRLIVGGILAAGTVDVLSTQVEPPSGNGATTARDVQAGRQARGLPPLTGQGVTPGVEIT